MVEPGGSGAAPVTTLRYEIALVPKLSIPSAAIVHIVRSGLPANIKAIARRAEEACALRSSRHTASPTANLHERDALLWCGQT